MASKQTEKLFDLPEQTLKSLSFSKADKESVAQWVKTLPVADMGKSTRMLYHAINEVSQLQTSAANRMELIEVLRPAIHLTCKGLRKNYLNQPVIMPDQPRKIANLSQALQMALATAYIQVAYQSLEKMGNLLKKPSALLSKAIFRALTEYDGLLLLNYMLYRPSPPGFWLAIHRLYQMAAKYKLEQLVQFHPSHPESPSSIEHLYKELLLWGCIRANQLRQDDIRHLKDFVPAWAELIDFKALDREDEGQFVVDPLSDLPPVYNKFYLGKYHSGCRSIRTTSLVKQLKSLSAPLVQGKSASLTSNLVNHLILAWGVFTGRTFMRLEANSRLSLCIGLSTTHYYLAGSQSFHQLVYGVDAKNNSAGVGAADFNEKTSQKDQLDVWDQSVYGTTEKSDAQKGNTQITMESIDYHIRTGGNSFMTFTGSDQEKYQNFEVDIVNMSPGGYCLEWSDNVSGAIKSGEIIGVKESHHNAWNIGAIRWVRQSKNKSLQIGVELLSPTAHAYGARITDTDGAPRSDFMRVLILPEIKTAGQPNSLITPALSFKAGQQVLLERGGKEHMIKLKKMIASSGSYFQFTFEDLQPLASTFSSGKIGDSLSISQDDDFDSVWDML